MEKESLTRYDIELVDPGRNGPRVEKFLHRVRGLSASPHDIIASCPCIIATRISKPNARKLAYYLEQLDAVVLLHHHDVAAPFSSPSAQKHSFNTHEPQRPQALMPRPSDGRSPDIPTSSTNHLHSHFSETEPYTPAQSALSSPRHAVSPAITLKQTVGELTQALQDKDWSVREHAIIELGKIPSDGIVRHMVAMLQDDVWRVRCTALYVLSQSGSDAVLRDIAKCLEDDVWHVRHQAVEALGRIESDKTVKPLLNALNDSSWQVRQRAAHILGTLQTRRALPSLIACLKDDVWSVRERAAEALARLKSEKAVKALIASLHDPHWRVRSMVITALKEIGSVEAIDALVEGLADEHWMIHWKAAYTLGHIGDQSILSILCRFAHENTPILAEKARHILRSLDIVAETRPHVQPHLAYRAETPYDTMQYIPAGQFVMGSAEGDEDAKPAQPVFLNEFFIDRYEVTNAQYAMFDPSHHYSEGKEAFPVVNVTWEEAQAYAAWAGKRLPTEAEWEKAARGTEGRLYPWGNLFDATRCNTEESGNRGLTAVDAYPGGASAFQVEDLFGNVLEWTTDVYRPYPGSQYTTPDFQEDFIVLRGSPWIHQGHATTCAARSYAPAANKSNFIGFRCVKDVE